MYEYVCNAENTISGEVLLEPGYISDSERCTQCQKSANTGCVSGFRAHAKRGGGGDVVTLLTYIYSYRKKFVKKRISRIWVGSQFSMRHLFCTNSFIEIFQKIECPVSKTNMFSYSYTNMI